MLIFVTTVTTNALYALTCFAQIAMIEQLSVLNVKLLCANAVNLSANTAEQLLARVAWQIAVIAKYPYAKSI